MPIHKLRREDLGDYGNILVSEAVPLDDPVPAPFTAHWCVVEPGATSERHMHREIEAFFVTSGRGLVAVDGVESEVEAGDTIYLDPLHDHTIHNPAENTDDLVFVTVYWADDDARAALAEPEPAAAERTAALAFVTPATPNGDLHLGHLAGPYLAADVWVRAARARGVDARFVTGSDDHQTYVEHKAWQLGKPVEETAELYGTRILAALEAVGARPDLFLRPAASAAHGERTAAFFTRLYESGALRREVVPTLYCKRCERHLFEIYVRGLCPHCGAATNGIGCEGCGRPNGCHDLVEPACNVCGGTPVPGTQERVVFPLEDYRHGLADFIGRASMGTHVRTLCERMLAEPLPTISVTHESAWGVPAPVPGLEGQVIWSWFEVASLYSAAAADMAASRGWSANGAEAGLHDGDVRVLQFFGFDNGYFKAILLTALFLAAGEEAPPSTFVTNEFYRLDGRKFSTSANHLVSVLDAVESTSPDLIRYYLCATRPARVETSYSAAELAETVQRELVEGWQGWLHGLGSKLREHFDGAAPDTGLWTEQHRSFESDLRGWCAEAERSLTAECFSPARLVRVLSELVREASELGAAELEWAVVPGRWDMFRTAVALELAAARALAILAAPVMPRFGCMLAEDLGLEQRGPAPAVAYLAPGTPVRLGRPYFEL